MEAITSEAIESVKQLAIDAEGIKILSADSEPKHVYYLAGKDGCQRVVAEPQPLAATIATPEAFVDFCKVQVPDTGQAITYYSESAIILLMDKKERRNKATCPLSLSPQYLWLEKQSNQQMSQANFVRLLRIVFAGCLDGFNLLNVIRNLKWSAGSGTEGNLQHGRESMGKSLTAEVRGENAIPEDVTLTIPIWENWRVNQQVRCAVEIFPQEQQFKILPFPLELRRAMDAALAGLKELLDQDGLPDCYEGKP